MNNTSNLLSTQEGLTAYFIKIKELQNNGEQFPVDLDKVWPLAYNRKEECVRFLYNKFMENIDYQILRRNAENSNNVDKRGRKPISHRITVSCMEYLIARRHRPVFEVYRRVFHSLTKDLSDREKTGNEDAKSVLRNSYIQENQNILDSKSETEEIVSYLRFCKNLSEISGTPYTIDVNHVWRLAFKSKRRVTDRLLGINGMPFIYRQWHDYVAEPAIRPDQIKACGHRFLLSAATFFEIIATRNENAKKAWKNVFGNDFTLLSNNCSDKKTDLDNINNSFPENNYLTVTKNKAGIADMLVRMINLHHRLQLKSDKQILLDAMLIIGKYNDMLNRTSIIIEQ